MKRYVKKIVMLAFMLLSAVTTYADIVKPPDVASIDAMVANHKNYSAFLGVRNVMEAGLDSIHGNTQKQIDNYKDTSDKLDKYKRGLKLIAAILQGAGTVIHFGNTLSNTTHNLSEYLSLIKLYEQEFLLKGNIIAEDTLILTTSQNMLKDLTKQSTALKSSLVEFGAMMVSAEAGFNQATVYETVNILNCINENMDNISTSVNVAYYRLWQHMLLRRFFHKKGLYGTRKRKDILDATVTSWEKAQRAAADVIINRRPLQKKYLLGGHGLLGESKRRETTTENS